MAYVIFNLKTKTYVHDKQKSWVSNAAEASRFHTVSTASNYINSQFIHIFKEVPREDVEIVDADCLGFTEESAAIELERCLAFFRESLEIRKKLSTLRDYYAHVNSVADMETQDLLHKIEFCNENAANGYKLYKQLHDVRQRRRTAKNGLEVASDLVKLISGANKEINKLLEIQNSRAYKPRVLIELFKD